MSNHEFYINGLNEREKNVVDLINELINAIGMLNNTLGTKTLQTALSFSLQSLLKRGKKRVVSKKKQELSEEI